MGVNGSETGKNDGVSGILVGETKRSVLFILML
jgi:hypothetical protein